MRVPTSLSYHIADIYVEELDKSLGSISDPLPAPLGTLFDPFFVLAARAPTSVTYKRIQSAVFEPLISTLEPEARSEEPPKSKRIRLNEDSPYPHLLKNACFDDPEREGTQDGADLKKKILRRMFEIASQPETRDSNRRKMYTLWKESYDEDVEEL